MSRSTPSLLALLGLVAVAGYQNRDRISEMLSDARQKSTVSGTPLEPARGGFIGCVSRVVEILLRRLPSGLICA